MIPPTFDYVAPKTVAEAVAVLEGNENAKILAGGQSLIPLMRFRLAGPTTLVDLNRVEGLSYIAEKDGWLTIGAMTRQSDVEFSDIVNAKYSLLSDTVRVLSDPVVRNRGTVGGNIANADPVNDEPAAMLAYGGEVVAVGPNGERLIPISEFYLDLYQSALARDEILTEVRVPAPKPRSGGAYLKLERKVGDYATAAAAVVLTLRGDVVDHCRIALTNVADVPLFAEAAVRLVMGSRLDAATLKGAAGYAERDARPASDGRGPAEYRKKMAGIMVSRALAKAASRAGT